MIPGCTNTLEFEIDGVNLTQASSVYASITQGIHKIVKTGDDVDVTVTTSQGDPPVTTSHVSVLLTQEETLRLEDNVPAEVQVHWLYNDARGFVQRGDTEAELIDIGKQLLRRVLP